MVSACRASSSTSSSERLNSRRSAPRRRRTPSSSRPRVVGVDHLGGLAADAALEDRRPVVAQRGLVDVELVGVDRALHDPLAQAVGGGDEDRVVEPGLGVHREHDAGRREVGTHHPLHARRERHLGVLEPVVHPVGDRAVVVQGGVDLTHGLQHRVDPAHVEEGLLLAGERGVGQVLRGALRTYGERRARRRPSDELLEGRPDLVLEPVGERLLDDPAADPLAGPGQRPGVVGVQALASPAIRSASPSAAMKRWNASAVVANPSGTLTPRSVRLQTISPSEAFLPPTWSRSSMPRSENHRTLGCHGGAPPAGRARGAAASLLRARRVCMITVEISSTDRAEVSTTGIRWAAYSCLARRSSHRHCSERGVARVGPALAADPASRSAVVISPKHRSRRPRTGAAGARLEVLVDQRVVGHEQAVLQREVHARGGLAAPRRRQQDHVGLLHGPQALAVVVLDGVLHRSHPVVVALEVADAVQPGRPTRMPWHAEDASTRAMCSSKKSMIGQPWCAASPRISSIAAVVKTSGVTGPPYRVEHRHDPRASSTVVMKGISFRSKRRSGNWMSSALPMVSALMPVLSERKKTGVAMVPESGEAVAAAIPAGPAPVLMALTVPRAPERATPRDGASTAERTAACLVPAPRARFRCRKGSSHPAQDARCAPCHEPVLGSTTTA